MNNKEKDMANRLKKLKKEIEVLEKEINHPKLTKAKKFTIKNLRIFAKTAELAAPYILCAGICASMCPVLGGGLPFKPNDDIKTYANIMTEYKSDGDIAIYKQYQYFENKDNVIKFYSKWNKNEDDSYSREIKTHKLKKIKEKDVLELLNKDDLNLFDVVSDLISIEEEKRTNLTEEEISSDEFYSFIMYSQDKKDVVYREETTEENILLTILYIMVSTLFGILSDLGRRKVTRFNYSNSINSIKSDYVKEDINDLKHRLTIRKENYNRLIK